MIEIKRIQQQPDVAQAIYEVMTDVYPVSPWTLEQIQADLSQDQTWYALAYDGEEVIGFLAIQENNFEAEVLQIAVLPSYQGQKIASVLFDFLPADKEIFLEVRKSNHRAQAFYKKEKMAVIAERKAYYHDPVEDAIIMKREIDEG
ncbi:ribosomal protein S18-alanine N-acetyltransferase [Streptococcus oralis]|uniref:[Ribosomal protein bS18]-alanine N-acetyltransferase n=1 Tax=Streptococcus oralis TaxID=1303 RepID=A0A7T4IRE8_STROR|nr:ribosomal protein S18-alanine N-acetyltransferase [Streptococcus oralis]QQC34786.1 ribosomal protein S18-alanine N-acetyltransferase [Streptococcus oralis]